MRKCNLAVDIGASNGRVFAGYVKDEHMHLKQIHRFDNQMIKKGNHFCWNIDELFKGIKDGIKKCNSAGLQPESIGIDTWAVDFVLLNENDELLTDAVSYRDSRTDGVMEEVFQSISKEEIYSRTGIQFQKFNTLYQLYSLKKNNPEILASARSFLMIPDYFNYLLTGKKVNEYTNATSTQLVNAHTKQWDQHLIESLDFNESMFQEIKPPMYEVGNLRGELVSEFGFDMKVFLPATHDTGSAVVSVPELDDTIYISSGTWSLIGTENDNPNCDEDALKYNFTNEGGLDYRFRFLKNIMGLWMIQEVKRNYNDQYSFEELMKLAKTTEEFSSQVNVNDDRFLKPESMIEEVQNYCLENKLPLPQTPGEISRCIFNSLAFSYGQAIDQIEEISGKTFKQINIIGGGSQNELINQLITNTTNKPVYSGPIEATAIGNIASQLIALGKCRNVGEARTMIKNSFDITTYTPSNINE
ncbi:rhamnulokinase [Halobacillus seohaensis]|uniref:Rhamnulokinase n=1 Tax=Halobacillus seohaensis TaxID=447421 RepID=A0ABW2EIQ2_9BACI